MTNLLDNLDPDLPVPNDVAMAAVDVLVRYVEERFNFEPFSDEPISAFHGNLQNMAYVIKQQEGRR